MVSSEIFQGVMAAIRAIKKLDNGESIVPQSQEHFDLTWAVSELYDAHMVDHTPLSGKNLERAQKIAASLCPDCGYYHPGGTCADS
jgi:hypothetical protein